MGKTLSAASETLPTKVYLIIVHSFFTAGVLPIIFGGGRSDQTLSFGLCMGGFVLLLHRPESLIAAVHALPYLGSFSFGGVTALVSLLFLMALIFLVRLVRRPSQMGNMPIMLMLLFFAYLLLDWYLSGQSSPEDGVGKMRLFFIRGIVPAALILTFSDAVHRLRGFLASTVAFSFLASVMVLSSYVGLSRIKGAMWGDSGRIALFGFDPISFSLPIGLACVIVFHFFVRGRRLLYRSALLALFVFMFFSIFPTGSRQTILSFAVGALVYSVVAYRSFLGKALVSVAVGLALILAFVVMTSHHKSERFDITSEKFLQSNSFQGRFTTMQKGWDTFRKAPLFGVGAGAYGKYILTTNTFTGAQTKEKEHIHNLFIELLAEEGILGLILFVMPVLIACLSLWGAIRVKSTDRDFRGSAAIMFAMLAFAVVQANISGGIAVSGGLIFSLAAWASVLAKDNSGSARSVLRTLPITAATR